MFHTPKKHCFLRLKISRLNTYVRTNVSNIWKNQSGLGLVEMAIVLIVIGIFLAGVVSKGRKMIEDAQRITTVGEISRYATAVSDFMKNTGKSSSDLLTLEWSEILGQKSHSVSLEKQSNDGNAANMNDPVDCPRLSNGGFLFIENRDGECYLILGKKGKRAFMTWVEANFLKKRLGDGVEMVHENAGSGAKADENSGLYFLRIPID